MPKGRNPTKFSRNPILLLALCFAFGIFVGNLVALDLKIWLEISFFLAALGYFFRLKSVATVFVAAAFMSAGGSVFQCEIKQNSETRLKAIYDGGTIASGDPIEIDGVLVGSPEPSFDSLFFTLRAEKLTHRGRERAVSGNVRLSLLITNSKFENPDLKYGSRVKIACKLEREDEFLNPGVTPKRVILDRLGIDATGSIKSDLLIEKIADESVFIPLAWVYDGRARMIEAFRQNLSPSASGVMIASLLGDKYFLDKNTANIFREGGTFHILIISGLHITFIGGILLLLVRTITRRRWIQFLVTTGILWGYTFAVGADVPVVRASIMFTVALFAYVIYRQANLLNALGFCALILLVWRPSDLFNPSFHLTFVSVAAIVGIAYPLIEMLRQIGNWTPSTRHPFPPNVPIVLRRFCETLYWNNEAWKIESKRQIWTARLIKSPFMAKAFRRSTQVVIRYLAEGILFSLIVQISMLPLTVIYFHRVSVAGVFLNIWVGLFISLVSFASVIGTLLNQFSNLLGTALFGLAETFNWLMLLLPRLFSENELASFRTPVYSGSGRAIYLFYGLLLLVLAMVLSAWKPFDLRRVSPLIRRAVLFPSVAVFFTLLLMVLFHPNSAPQPDGRLHLEFLDVGQGDSALVTFPNGRTLLIDAGGRIGYKRENDGDEPFEPDVRRIGEAVVSEFLWQRGYSRIDFILATHADADHIQGLTDVSKNFQIGAALFGRMPMADPEFVALESILRRRSVPIEKIAGGEEFYVGDVLVEVLNPSASDDREAVSDNDHSVVLRITYGTRAFLLTGDIERRTELDLVLSGEKLKADLIKVAHHGSRTSSISEFVDATQAKYAVIPVGRSSPFGHPHREVVERWKAAGAEVITTGEKGTVSFSTDGNDLVFSRFIK